MSRPGDTYDLAEHFLSDTLLDAGFDVLAAEKASPSVEDVTTLVAYLGKEKWTITVVREDQE